MVVDAAGRTAAVTPSAMQMPQPGEEVSAAVVPTLGTKKQVTLPGEKADGVGAGMIALRDTGEPSPVRGRSVCLVLSGPLPARLAIFVITAFFRPTPVVPAWE